MLFFLYPNGIREWDKGATSDFCTPYALLGQVGIAEEQGWRAGQTALETLNGTKPSATPVTTNKQSKLYLNMELAKAMGITFPMSLIEQAIFVGEE